MVIYSRSLEEAEAVMRNREIREMRTLKTKSLIAAAVFATLAGCVGTGVKNESGPVAPVAEKELAPLRVAVYVDKGARNIGAFRWLELTARAKNVVATPIDGEAVRRGALAAAAVRRNTRRLARRASRR